MLASEAIDRAYREINRTAVGQSPTTAQQTEALALLNSVLLAAVGFEAGEELSDITIGGQYDQATLAGTYIPVNARLVVNLTGARTFYLHPRPHDGQRVAIADAGANLATYNLTLNGNGRSIEGGTTAVLAANSLARQWLYRADLGDWKRITSLEAADTVPFPTEFDDYFVILLAMRISPRHGRELATSSAMWFEAVKAQFEARYRRPRTPDDVPYGMLRGDGFYDARNLLQ